MNANKDIRNILFLARRYGAHHNHTLGTVSLRAAGQGQYLQRLEEGHIGLTFRRGEKLMKWFSENWPSDLQWPADIPRPRKNKDAA